MRMQLDLSLNPFIASHLPLLMTHIQELALCQYVVPFVSIRLQVLALRLPCPASSHASSSMTIVTAASGEMKCLPNRFLQALATTFNMSVPDVEKIICNLIERRQVFLFLYTFSLFFYFPRHLKLLNVLAP